MRIRNNRRRILAMAGLAIGFLVASNVVCAQVPCGYEVTAIIQAPECPPFGIPPTIGTAISEPIDGGLPNVVGYYQSCLIGPNTGFIWIGNENSFTTLDFPFGTSQSQANGISADGTLIVGTADVVGEGTRAFLFDGKELTIIPPAGGSFSQAGAVNSQRQIVGTTPDPTTGFNRAFRWEDEVMTLIEPTFGPRSVGMDISEFGAVVGWMGTSTNTDSHSFIWNNGKMEDIGLAPNTIASNARGINDIDQILIWGVFKEGDPKGRLTASFLWEYGEFIDLGALPLYDVINGRSVNDNSQVVGMARAVDISDELDTGFIWQDGLMRNLNDLIDPDAGLWIRRAEAINEMGQITGRATSPDGTVAFLLTPIEPPLGDLNGDCLVGATDLLILLASWGPCGDCDNCPADLDGNCVVGASDLLILLVNWG